jgi:dCTP deaminase
MSILSCDDIKLEMQKEIDPLVITPLLEEKQIGAASVDIRLGHQFIVLRKSSVPVIDPITTGSSRTYDWEVTLHRSQERLRISLFRDFIIHPGQLVLAATLEYLAVPRTIAATVEGRSSWGRLGLFIATASTIGPGFKGCVTLELVNSGEVPLVLRPGVRIAQIIFQRLSGVAEYSGKYDCPVGPQFSRAHADSELHLWSKPPTP